MRKIFRIVLILIVVIGTASVVKSQEQRVSFKFVEKNGNLNTAIFSIYGIKNNEDAQRLKEFMLEDNNIKSFKIFYNRRCKIQYLNKINADDIRLKLQTFNADYDKDYVNVLDKYVEEELMQVIKNNYDDYKDRRKKIKGTWELPSDYPQKTESNKKNYKQLKIKWIESHPYKYKEITGKEYLDMVNHTVYVK